jgi:hypothetical protein
LHVLVKLLGTLSLALVALFIWWNHPVIRQLAD